MKKIARKNWFDYEGTVILEQENKFAQQAEPERKDLVAAVKRTIEWKDKPHFWKFMELPLELRQHIYDYLRPISPMSRSLIDDIPSLSARNQWLIQEQIDYSKCQLIEGTWCDFFLTHRAAYLPQISLTSKSVREEIAYHYLATSNVTLYFDGVHSFLFHFELSFLQNRYLGTKAYEKIQELTIDITHLCSEDSWRAMQDSVGFAARRSQLRCLNLIFVPCSGIAHEFLRDDFDHLLIRDRDVARPLTLAGSDIKESALTSFACLSQVQKLRFTLKSQSNWSEPLEVSYWEILEHVGQRLLEAYANQGKSIEMSLCLLGAPYIPSQVKTLSLMRDEGKQ